MKSHNFLAASGLALAAFLMAQPATAQSNSMPAPSGDRVDANGMPTTHSTPQEQAQTADLNAQVTQSNAEISAQDNNNKAKYQIEQQQYQEQLQQTSGRSRRTIRTRKRLIRIRGHIMKPCASVIARNAPPITAMYGPPICRMAPKE